MQFKIGFALSEEKKEETEAPAEEKQPQQESAPESDVDVLQIVEESIVEDLL